MTKRTSYDPETGKPWKPETEKRWEVDLGNGKKLLILTDTELSTFDPDEVLVLKYLGGLKEVKR